MWPKFTFPVIVIVYYWLLLSAVSLSTHFAVLGPLQCLLTLSLLFSEQKCNITGRVNIVGRGQGQECVSAVGYCIVLKTQKGSPLTASNYGNVINNLHLEFRSVNCLTISRPLKLSKVSVQCCSQEYLFGEFSANYYQIICGRVHF